MALISVRDLSVRYEPRLNPAVTAVDHVSFDLAEGEFVGLIGESGSGKSTLGLALLRLLERPARVSGGEVRFGGADLLTMSADDLRGRRWSEISTVFQSSMNSLNPVARIERSFSDVLAAHTDLDAGARRSRAGELLEMVSIEPRFLSSYPHELSGGMKQRINLALALALKPAFVLLDEPTTGLDVVVQRTILDNIRSLQRENGFTVLFISHDMGAVLESSDRIMVMYAGRLVEVGDAAAVHGRPLHPYTKALLGSYGNPQAETVTVTYIPGRPPSLVSRPPGCAFAPRCPEAVPSCVRIDPPLEPIDHSLAACIVAAAQHGVRDLPDPVGPPVTGFAGPAFTRAAGAGADPDTGAGAGAHPATVAAPGAAAPGAAASAADARVVAGAPVIEVEGVSRTFTRRRRFTTTSTLAVDDVGFTLRSGRVTALVGQSGSGKSTLARLITGVERPDTGHVRWCPPGGAPVEVSDLKGRLLAEFRRSVQYVFQDPYAALNPAHPVGVSMAAPLRNFQRLRGRPAQDRAAELLDRVGLSPGAGFLRRYPYELSGGQRQRVVIARALASDPRLLVADEPIASLDVSIRAEILEVLAGLVDQEGVGILYITHDLLSARMLADDILVLHHGVVVESGPAREVITHPTADYTRTLLAAVPQPGGRAAAQPVAG